MSGSIDRFRSWWRSRRLEEQPVPEDDPIVNSSLSVSIAVSSLLLMLTLVWALYDEVWGLRPWIDHQEQFVEVYRKALLKMRPERAEEEKRILSSEGYQELQQKVQQAETEVEQELGRIEDQERAVDSDLVAITKTFTTERSRIQAKIYELETADENEKQDLGTELEELRVRSYTFDKLAGETGGSNGANGVQTYTYVELEELFNELKARQGQLQGQKVALLRKPTQERRQLNDYKQKRLTSLTETQVDGLLGRLDNFNTEIKQIHVVEMGLVDRCGSCHLGIREPVELTRDDLDGNAVFVSHPRPELLDVHDPEVFGCSPCHNGNGVATVNETKAHGYYKHWLWPLYATENFEAGCLQCHEADRHLEMSHTLNAGKQLFYEKGCWGCHPREGFDQEPRLLRDAQKTINDLIGQREETELQIVRTVARADEAETNEEASRLYARADQLTMGIADVETQVSRLRTREEELLMEVKKVGPDLKEVRVKLRKEWIPVWIENPHAFRPTTKMPRFRLEEDQVEAISAFIWQSGIAAELTKHSRGNPVRGKTLLETRGCLACHAIGEGDSTMGGTFAANLSRVGEKANYDYLVRWVHNPRERTLPYCPTHERDITPEDYASQGLAFKFDTEHSRCPLGDHLLQVQQPTVMPNLRLTGQESRDIASYLVTQKNEDSQYPSAAHMDDPQLFEKGRALVRHFGCRGCHEIAGLEQEGTIGTDLTIEGSKPIERLDFALLTKQAKKEKWYNHKGFFERKLAEPDIFDQDKKKEPLERLRMPDFDLSEEEIDQLTTFLLGSVASKIPEPFFYQPADERHHIQEGWWVVMKYNCVACHQFTPAQQTVVEQLPFYDSPEKRELLPPSLVGEGARTEPNWLARFLKNPALNDREQNQNGVRSYLETRMPTFDLSDEEIHKLVRFFSALSKQSLPYAPPLLQPLTSRELTMARDLFTHRTAPCLKCHATGDPVTDRTATAPNFLLVPERLKPDWTERWIKEPQIIRPGTNMPAGLFRREGGRWVFALGDVPSLRAYDGDHAQLMVRYMFQFSPAEQRRLKRR